MPIYEYQCHSEDCSRPVVTSYRHMQYRNAPTVCTECGARAHRIIERANVNPDLQPYYDENLCAPSSTQGNWVQSRRHKRQLLKDYGLGEL